MFRLIWLSLVVFLSAAAPTLAQQPAVTPPADPDSAMSILASALKSGQAKLERKSETHWVLSGQVDLPIQGGTSLSADEVNLYFDRDQLAATGNVVFTNPQGRVSAEKIEFDFKDGSAVFHVASGIMSLGATANIAEFGNQDPDVYIWGERIEKLSAKKYLITRGGFTACVQPTPRWELTTGTIELNLDDYALARNVVLRVKGVPLFYLPVVYYPLQEDQRSTGFLMPTYGTSRLRGGSLSNAFFWAIGRSQDATFYHDWFSKAGQGAGGEYRYIASSGSSGQLRYYRFNQRQADYANDGRVSSVDASTSHELQVGIVHDVARGVTVRARTEYASNLVTQQLYQQNVYRASNPVRVVEGSVTGIWGALSANALYLRSEVFSSTTLSTISGSTPRLGASVAPTRLFGLPIYASINSEYSNNPYRFVSNGAVGTDLSFTRFDMTPSVSVPFSKLSFLTVNTNASYRTTYFDRSRDTEGRASTEPIGRTYYALRSDIVGPVFNKVWDTPESDTVDRMKHIVEPAFTFDYVANFANAARLPSLTHVSDVIIGGATSITYGLNNRFLSRKRKTETAAPTSQEFLSIGVQQTYYSNPEASRWDFRYAGSASRSKFVDLSPIAVTTRLSPNATVSANTRIEYDVSGLGLQTVSLGGSVNSSTTTASASYSRVVYGPGALTNTLTLANQTQFLQGRATGSYSLSWDLARSYVVSQSLTARYLAQCCGVTVEFQQYNFPDVVGFPLSSDRRLNFGFVLAGLGTFSNFFGAFGGQQ